MQAKQLIFTALPELPLIHPGDDLVQLIVDGMDRAELTAEEGDVFILAQKIVSKSEGRLVYLPEIEPSAEALELAEKIGKDPRILEIILGESSSILRLREGLIVVEHRLGFVCANAGVDRSNVRGEYGEDDDWVLLLPEDPDRSAHLLRDGLVRETGKQVAVLIIDSHGRAWRMGTAGVCIGAAGFPVLLDLRGEPDLFDVILKSTEVGLADEIASGASVLMGQANEGRPVIHLRGLPYPLREGSVREIVRSKEDDLFR
ncbi:MAG: coenzyme F420-0:L-glutamate ligase [Anaerolineales bacterium]|nr:coenzyme F420-0:L-glutamate ligase [Anaerolineales bacterium]